MKKCDLLKLLTRQQGLARQSKGLAKLISLTADLSECPRSDLCASQSLLNELHDHQVANLKVISEAIAELDLAS